MKNELLATLRPHGQEHLLAFWDRLDDARRRSLAEQIEAIDLDLIDRLYARRDDEGDARSLADRAGPPPAFRLDAPLNRFSPEQADRCGREALAAGEVGAILVAGGQGTRLGFDRPKGMFAIGPISGRSLFQIHVEKLVAAGHRYGVRIPLYLMTSPATHDETVRFFAEHDRFGLAGEDLRVFCQATMPAVDEATGRILLASPGEIARSPDGHGGMLAALARSGGLANVRRRRLRHLFYFQVDNPLVDVCWPEFLGYHVLSESEMSTQVIAKRDPLERVGNVVEVDGRLRVIEYSDLPDDAARRRNDDGSLRIWAGSIAVHVFDAAMLERSAGSAEALPFHIARKKVAHVDARGNRVEPAEPNAVKFERFIFDLMPWARNAVVVEIDPAEGFAPLKNAPGAATDTPEWVRERMTAQHRRWLRAAGAEVADDVPVEISPLFVLDPAELREKIAPGTRVTKPTYFDPNPKSEIRNPKSETNPKSQCPMTGHLEHSCFEFGICFGFRASDFGFQDMRARRAEVTTQDSNPQSPIMLHAVIMAGGTGTRFWPESRARRPKQLLRLAGDETMIRATVERLGGLVPADRLLVATTAELAEPIAAELPELPLASILAEPCKRDTAPCIGLAAFRCARDDPDATMAVVAADHVICRDESFEAGVRFAAELVQQRPSRMVTFGIRPTYPAESFGYIERGEEIAAFSGNPPARVYHVERFHEKPDAETAAEYLRQGTFYWNSGIFVWKAKTILDALAKHQPEMYARLVRIANAAGTYESEEVLVREFTAIEGISIDYAVLEHATDVVVVEAPFDWDDLGSWQSFARLCGTDAAGNAVAANHLAVDTTGSIVRGTDDHLIVTVGLSDVLVVHTPDATLVANKHDEESIRKVVALLEEWGWEEYL